MLMLAALMFYTSFVSMTSADIAPFAYQARESWCNFPTVPQLTKCRCTNGTEQTVININCTNTAFTDLSFLRRLPHEDLSSSLESIIMTGNNFDEIPINFLANCSKGTNTYKRSYLSLTMLDFSNNNINLIHGKSFHCIQNLEILYLNDNNLDHYAQNARMFSDLEQLQELHLRNSFNFDKWSKNGTSLSKVFGDSGMQKLKILHLENNYFGSIVSDVFSHLRSLEQLYLSYNYIQNPFISASCYLEDGQKITCPLRSIYLSNNSITYVSEKFIAELDKMLPHIVVDFSNNLFWCDCNLIPFYNWMKNASRIALLANQDHYRCSGPPDLSGQYIADLPAESLDKCTEISGTDMQKETHAAQVALIIVFSLIALFVVAALVVNRKILKNKAMTVLGPYIPRLFSRARGYTTVSNISTTV